MTHPSSRHHSDDNPARYARRSAWLGGAIWLLALAWSHPSPFTPMWAVTLLLLAPLVLVPLGLRLVEPDGTWVVLRAVWRMAVIMQFPAAILLWPAFLLSQGIVAAALTVPWLLTTLLIALTGVLRLWLQRSHVPAEVAINAGLVYVAIGGVWLLLDRFGARPLQFEAIIVLLTAIHFHYAGFLLPIFTGLAGRVWDGRVARLAAIGVSMGVPLVAFGITATQLGFNPLVEALAAIFTSLAGLLTAALHIRMATGAVVAAPSGATDKAVLAPKGTAAPTRFLFALCGLALAFSMLQAALYGVRFYIVLEWLALPWMRALHGTANAVGFGLMGVLGWNLASKADR